MRPKPLVLRTSVLRALASCAHSSKPHLAVIDFQPRRAVATDGILMLVVDLPEDEGRRFRLPVGSLARQREVWPTTIQIRRRSDSTIIETGPEFRFKLETVDDSPRARGFPSSTVAKIIDATPGDFPPSSFAIAGERLARVGQIAADIGTWPGNLSISAVRLVTVGSPERQEPARFAFTTEHGHAQVIVMPVRVPL